MTRGKKTRLQQEIEDGIIKYISDCHLTKGDKLPSQEELASILNVSRVALRESLTRLESQGVIEQIHGVGTFVTNDPKIIHTRAEINLSISEIIRNQGMVPGTSEIEMSKEKFPIYDGNENNLNALCIKRVRTADGNPFVYSIAYIRDDLPGLPEDPEIYTNSIWETLKSFCGKQIMRAEAEIRADTAVGILSEKLGVSKDFPLLVMCQKQFDQEDKILIISKDYYLQRSLHLSIMRFRPGPDIVSGGIR
ncbi:MAG TPA: GntR family transcriptional regulator [Flexilinea sp.]|jgi:GntR family transcriptional regulator|nr:GntR family transcriptional regulator [Flexilinea sp.]HQJ02020.1 GntR family transcriptional regulator [Flexilinea sp.]